MGRSTVWALALLLLFVACTEDSETTTTLEHGPGRLVVLDSTGDVVVLDPDGANDSPVTEDAAEHVIYTQPVWSPDGSVLAWGQATEDGFAVAIQDPKSETRTLVETSNLPFYTYWSPDGETIGVLHNGTAGVDFRMVDVSEGTSRTVDSASPYYFSWSPSGDRVVTHAGEDRVEEITTDGNRRRLEPTSPDYLAPQWTPHGVFHVVGNELMLEDGAGGRVPIATVSGFTTFVANPQGTIVALQTTGDNTAIPIALADEPTMPVGGVMAVDVETGSVESVTHGPSAGFFWSPDGESLLVMRPGSVGIAPLVWTRSGSSRDFTAYRPPANIVRNTLPFFPQYAQSIDFWSPDSSQFTFAGDIDGDQGIWVQDVDQDLPQKVSDGTWVAWSAG
jgi:TolB protein